MTGTAGDHVKASVFIRLDTDRAFDLFTREIDRWWRRGPRYRNDTSVSGIMHMEPCLHGRVFESSTGQAGERVFEIGRIIEWSPPVRLAFTWRNQVFGNTENTLVEVDFVAQGGGTTVTVVHRGWAGIPKDHPARHGMQVREFQQSLGAWWGNQLASLRSVGT